MLFCAGSCPVSLLAPVYGAHDQMNFDDDPWERTLHQEQYRRIPSKRTWYRVCSTGPLQLLFDHEHQHSRPILVVSFPFLFRVSPVFFTQSWVGQDAKPSTCINCLSQKTHIMTPCRGLKYQLAVQAIYIFWWDVSASQPETISNMFQCFKLFTNTLPPHALDSKQRVSTLFQKWEISQSGKICQETHSDYSSSKFCKEPIQPTADEPPIAKFAQTFFPELASNANLYT